MLNELDALSQQIGRLILSNDQYRQTQRNLTQQLTQMRVRLDEIQSAFERICDERDALRTERDSLVNTIDEAYAHLHALLERLPPPSSISTALSTQVEEDTYGENA